MSAVHTALELDPKFADAHNSMGAILARQGRHEEALVSYKESLRLDEEKGLTYFNMANSLEAVGNRDAAVIAWRVAANLDHEGAKELLATFGLA